MEDGGGGTTGGWWREVSAKPITPVAEQPEARTGLAKRLTVPGSRPGQPGRHHPASILHPSPTVLHPPRFILHPSSCILHPPSPFRLGPGGALSLAELMGDELSARPRALWKDQRAA